MNMLLTKLNPCLISHHVKQLNSKIGTIRLLFTREELGVDRFENDRIRQRKKFKNFEKIKQFITVLPSKFTLLPLNEKRDQLKIYLNVIDGNETELDVLKMLLRNYHHELTTTAHSVAPFCFGTQIMRMFYLNNSPDVALKYFNDPQLNELFDQQSSYKILFNLLYKHKRYDDIYQIYQQLWHNREKCGMRPVRTLDCLVFAACYHLNTPEHLNYALNLWNKVKDYNNLKRCRHFLAALALKQNYPDKALKIIGDDRYHVIPRLICLNACIQTGDFDKALIIIEEAATRVNLIASVRQKINKQIFEHLKSAINKSGTIKQMQQIMLLDVIIKKENLFDDDTLEHLLLKPFPTMLPKSVFKKIQRKEFDPRNDY